MRFCYAEAMIDPDFYLPLATAVEEAGYTSMTVADSIAYPEVSDSTYPYTSDGDRGFLEDKPFVEPFVLTAAMGAVTSTLRFTPFVLKLPIRPPALVAKQASSLAALLGGRLSLGVGISPWPEDFDIMGVPFARRGKRMDECLDILRGLTTGEYFSYDGEFYTLPKVKMSPAPREPIPLLVGGHSEPALRRAVLRGDGWLHAGSQPEELDLLLARLRSIREAEGRADRPFEVQVISLDAYTPDGVKRLADRGITEVIVGFRLPYHRGPDTEPLQVKLDNLRRYADTVIAKVNG
ncbi:MAG: TIGR03619 family F420-dependent LLM class oxidoreductase [Thermocrispum sp.]